MHIPLYFELFEFNIDAACKHRKDCCTACAVKRQARFDTGFVGKEENAHTFSVPLFDYTGRGAAVWNKARTTDTSQMECFSQFIIIIIFQPQTELRRTVNEQILASTTQPMILLRFFFQLKNDRGPTLFFCLLFALAVDPYGKKC